MSANAHYVQIYDNGEVLAWPCFVDQGTNRIEEFYEQDMGTPFAQVPDWAMLAEEYVEWPGGMRNHCMKDREFNDYYADGEAAGNARIQAEYGDAILITFDDGQIPG